MGKEYYSSYSRLKLIVELVLSTDHTIVTKNAFEERMIFNFIVTNFQTTHTQFLQGARKSAKNGRQSI